LKQELLLVMRNHHHSSRNQLEPQLVQLAGATTPAVTNTMAQFPATMQQTIYMEKEHLYLLESRKQIGQVLKIQTIKN